MLRLSDAVDYGYEQDDNGKMQPLMMSQSPTAPKLLNDIICDYKENCDEEFWYQNTQPCTAAYTPVRLGLPLVYNQLATNLPRS